MRRQVIRVALTLGSLLGGFAGASCGGDNMGGAEEADAGASADAPGPAVPGAKFSEIYPMLFPNNTNARCNFCHGMPANEVSNGKLSVGMDMAAAWAALVGKNSASAKCNGKPLIVPGQPEASLFLQKLGPTPPCGSRMPVGGAALSDTQLDMVRSWIAAGAKND